MPDPTLVEVTPGFLRSWPLPAHRGDEGKQGRGQVLVVGGAAQTPGAVLLAGVAALRTGAGKLAMATVVSTAMTIAVNVPEALVQALPETADGAIDVGAVDRLAHMAASATAVLIGPGMTEQEMCCDLVTQLLAALPPDTGIKVVLDALALAVVERDPRVLARFDGEVVLTPNPKELALMVGHDLGEPLATAREAAERFGAVVSLGGGDAYVAAPDGSAWHETAGSVGLGVSGSGDTEAGVVAGLLARGATATQAAVWAAHLHGTAGDHLATRLGRVGYLAREVADEVPRVLSQYD